MKPTCSLRSDAELANTNQLYQFPIRLIDLKPNHCQIAVLDPSDEYQLRIKPMITKRKNLEFTITIIESVSD